jgi:hypothetical protein
LPFAGLAACCVLTTVVLRALYLSGGSEYQVSRNLPAFFTTLLWQTTAALPLSYFLADPASLFTDPLFQWKALSKVAGSASSVLIFAGVFTAGWRSLPGAPGRDGHRVLRPTRFLILLGLGLIVLPAVLVSVSVRYQKLIGPGKGYVPVYIESYGAALLLSTTTWGMFSRLLAARHTLRWHRPVVACLVAAVATGTYRANSRVAEAIVTPPGLPGYNAVAAEVLGCYHHQRLNLEAALQAGLVEDVPDGSIVYLTSEYPWWYERHHASSFFAMHSSKKRLRAIPLEDTFFPDAPPTRESILAVPGPTRPFLVRDVCLGGKAGYVVLSDAPAARGEGSPREADNRGPGELRVFVRHPKLFAYGLTPTLIFRGNGMPADEESPAAGGEDSFERQAHDITILKSGSDWVLVSLRSDVGQIDPDSLRALIGPLPAESGDNPLVGPASERNLPVTAEWGDGFCPVEVNPDGWWRWCGRRGVLTLRNTTKTPHKVKISMLLQGKRDCPLTFDGESLHEEVTARVVPGRFERELTIAPGTYRVSISTTALPRAARQSPGQRFAAFRIINYRIDAHAVADGEGSMGTARVSGRDDNNAFRR